MENATTRVTDAGQLSADARSNRFGSAGCGLRFTYGEGARPLEGYTIKRGIGIGGFGEVYYALTDAGKRVALKYVQFHRDVELRGASHCLNLKHPHLVALYDIRYDADGQAWIVMEYVSGESLKDVLMRYPRGLPLAEVARWFEAICSAVAYLHDHAIVHRDLKPANIFDDQGTVKVGDYGLAKCITFSRQGGHTESVGTCHYTAPEIRNGTYGKEVDIYALGVILYEMLTGRVPFDGESAQEVLMKHLVDHPDLTRLAEPFRPVLRRALAKDPARRFASARQMCDAFRRAVELYTGGDGSRVAAAAGCPSSVPQQAGDRPAIAEELPDSGEECKPEGAGTTATVRPPPLPPLVGKTRNVPPPLPPGNSPGGAVWPRQGWPAWLPALAILAAVVALSGHAPWLTAAGLLVLVAYGATELWRVRWPGWSDRHARLRHAQLVRQRQQMRDFCRSKPILVKLDELLAGWLCAAFWCTLMAGLLSLPGTGLVSDWLHGATLALWLAFQAALLSGVVLAWSKWWEGRTDGGGRRLVMGASGLAVGGAGLAWCQWLQTPIDTLGPTGMHDSELPAWLAVVIYFGLLMLLPAWWRLADPLRHRRFSCGKTVVAGLWALVLHAVLPVPHPLGLMTAVISAIAIQLSSPWLVGEEFSKSFRHSPRT
ncbi:MAG: hypothetical protein KatS3mg110_2643 [Pirellulaceae bacterium]|nr:MAG: hypothetical protein KatS3mg110_2643 [Pirellulaceae bacterium]